MWFFNSDLVFLVLWHPWDMSTCSVLMSVRVLSICMRECTVPATRWRLWTTWEPRTNLWTICLRNGLRNVPWITLSGESHVTHRRSVCGILTRKSWSAVLSSRPHRSPSSSSSCHPSPSLPLLPCDVKIVIVGRVEKHNYRAHWRGFLCRESSGR